MPQFRYRTATAADAEALAETVAEGVAEYRAFAPAGWQPAGHPVEFDETSWTLLAEAEGAPAGHVAFRPASLHRYADPDPRLAHLGALFVRAGFRGSGVAAELLRRAAAEAASQDYARGRLFVAAGYARARRFYEREGWAAAGEPFAEPAWGGLELVEYRRECSATSARRPSS